MESRRHHGQHVQFSSSAVGPKREALARLKAALREAAEVGLFECLTPSVLPELAEAFSDEIGRSDLIDFASPREWISIEVSDQPTFNGRIPLLATKTAAGVFAWIAAMHDAGLTFHPDDDPEDIVRGLYGGRVFSDDEVPVVREQLEAARETVPEEQIYLALDVASGMAKHRIDDALASSGWTVELGHVGTLIFERKNDPGCAVLWRVTDPRERFDGERLPVMTEDLGYALDTLTNVAAIGTPSAQEVFQGRFSHDGEVLNVEFSVPVGATREQKDAAMLGALSQVADVDYLAVGEASPTPTP